MTESAQHDRSNALPGILLHAPGFYDFQVWLATGGRERRLRESILRVARPAPGEHVLDVGCGTGTFAIAMKRLVGAAGRAAGIDASREMTISARRKARKAGVELEVQEGLAQALPFADESFDLAASTLMLHHLPRSARQACAREIARVLKPGGRALAVDFATSSKEQGGLFHRLHRHGLVRLEEIVALMEAAGLKVVDTGPIGMRDLNYVLATKPIAG